MRPSLAPGRFAKTIRYNRDVKVALAQHNPTIGDFEGNVRQIDDSLCRAEAAGAELLVTSELGICGYPPRDLVERPAFVQAARQAVEALAARVGDTAVV